MKINKREVARVLESMGKKLIGDTTTLSEDGDSIDFKKFNEHIEVKNTVLKLKELGVKSHRHLSELGFIPASMIMRF